MAIVVIAGLAVLTGYVTLLIVVASIIVIVMVHELGTSWRPSAAG